MHLTLVLPLIIPLATAIAGLLAYRSRRMQRAASAVGAAGLFAASLALLVDVLRHGTQVAQIDNWPAPFGISLVADLLSVIMIVLTGTIGLVVVLYALASIDPLRERFGFHPLLHFLLLGVAGAFLTGDLFNLYVWFEVMLMASFVLMALGGERAQMEGAIKYVTINLLASAIFLAALGLTYGLVGTLNMADVASKLALLGASRPAGVITALSGLYLAAFGIKAAIFPLYFWLPASYHTPPMAVTALFAGLLTKVGAYALIRIFSLIFVHDVSFTHTLILGLGALTMISGVLGAVAQYDMRRLLSFHIISQIGYLLMGLGLLTPLSLAGAVFFTVHVALAKTALFLVAGAVGRLEGTFDLRRLGGLVRRRPVLAALFFIPAMALAGVPPLSGFFAKLSLVIAGLSQGRHALVAVALGVSLLTLFSMIKIWNEAFWKARPAPADPAAGPAPRLAGWYLPAALLAALVIVLGLGAGPGFDLALRAGEQLASPQAYIAAVLGTPP